MRPRCGASLRRACQKPPVPVVIPVPGASSFPDTEMCGTLSGMSTTDGGFLHGERILSIVGNDEPEVIVPLANGGLIHGGCAPLVGDQRGIDYIVPLRAWDRGHERLRIFDAARMIYREPSLPAVVDFVTPLLRQMLDRQMEQLAALPSAPEGYEWQIITEWPQMDIDAMHDARITWRWVLRSVDGSDQ